jgi:hypothetical protein
LYKGRENRREAGEATGGKLPAKVEDYIFFRLSGTGSIFPFFYGSDRIIDQDRIAPVNLHGSYIPVGQNHCSQMHLPFDMPALQQCRIHGRDSIDDFTGRFRNFLRERRRRSANAPDEHEENNQTSEPSLTASPNSLCEATNLQEHVL